MDNEKRYEEIVFTEEQFGDTVDLYRAVKNQLQLLLDAGYTAVVRLDDVGIVVIQFQHDERFEPWGVASPVWLTEDEMLYLRDKDNEYCEECPNFENCEDYPKNE